METTQNTQIQLTEAEIVMINLKREEAELNAKKEAAEKLIKEGKEIEEKRKKIEYDQKRDLRLVKEIEDLFNELPNKNEYSLVDYSRVEEYKCYHYDSSKPEGEREVVYFKESIKRPGKKINHKSGAYITAHFHTVSSGSGVWSRSKEDGTVRFKLDISGVYDGKNNSLVSAKTIDKKIQEVVAEKKRKEEARKAKLEGIEWLTKQIADKYPQAVVTQEQESGYRVEYGPDRGWKQGAKFIRATFKSGLVLDFTWRNFEGSLQVVKKGHDFSKVSDEKFEAFINSLI